MTQTLIYADCLDALPEIPENSVDLILTDLPYGTTQCKWDTVIPLEPLWAEYKRVIKPYGAIVLFSQQPFTTTLIDSNMDEFKYQWVWLKNRPSGVAQAKNKPLSQHEDICVFSNGTTVHASQSTKRMPYNPQGLVRIDKVCKNRQNPTRGGGVASRPSHKKEYVQEFTNYPKTFLEFDCERGLHPTQKPVPLLEYLIKTYTEPGETVLDSTMGSGSTGEAAFNTGRHFIGMEKEPEYFEKAQKRLEIANLI